MTQSEWSALQSQRGELKNQLTDLNKRRNQLQEQRSGLSADAGRDHDLRMREIDVRSAEIDRQLMRLDVQIANGLGQPLIEDRPGLRNQTSTTAPPLLPPGISSDGQKAIILGGLALTAVSVYVIFLAARRFLMPNKKSLESESRRLDQLQQSVDVIALEIERMSESQRFVAKVLSEKFPALGVGEAQPVSARAKDAAKV
jgi:chromosome segregation ATPase